MLQVLSQLSFFVTADVLDRDGPPTCCSFCNESFSMRQTCKPPYDHSQLHAPWDSVMQKRQMTTWHVDGQVVLLLVLLQALRHLKLLLELRPPVLRSPRPARYLDLRFYPETEMHAFLIALCLHTPWQPPVPLRPWEVGLGAFLGHKYCSNAAVFQLFRRYTSGSSWFYLLKSILNFDKWTKKDEQRWAFICVCIKKRLISSV